MPKHCLSLTAVAILVVLARGASAQTLLFERGDVNVDEAVNVSDAIRLLEGLFLNDGPFDCADAADVDDDGHLNISDAVYLLRFSFTGGSAPPPPFEGCGLDPSEDSLPCGSFERCVELPELCLTPELLGETLGPIPGFDFCLPAGLLEFPLEGLEISVCPAEDAPPCGATEQPGCAIELTGFEPFVDLDERSVGIRVEGVIEDLPIEVTEGFLGTTTTCETDFGGSEEGAPFSFEILFLLDTTEIEPGVHEITGIGESEIANVDIELDSSGGIVCALFEAGQDLFIELLLAPLAEVLGSVTDGLGDAVVGLRICDE